MNNVSLRQLRAFVEIARGGSFRIASQRLHVSQPALTATIKDLEAQIGLKLFDRTTRRVLLTEPATRFLPVAERLLMDVDHAVSNVRLDAQYESGHIVFAITGSVFAHLGSTIAGFVRDHPRVSLHVRDGGARGPQHRVSMGEVDFAIANVMESDPSLDEAYLFSDVFGVLCRPEHPLASSTQPVGWDALAGERYIGMATEVGVGAVLRKNDLLPRHIRQTHYEVSNPILLQVLMKEIGGVSVMPELTAKLDALAQFVFRPLHPPTVKRDVFLIRRQERSLSPAAAELVRRIKDATTGASPASPTGDADAGENE